MKKPTELKVALICSGLGHVKRGFESFSEELFSLLKEDINITLFKGGGTSNNREKVLPCLKRESFIRLFGLSAQKRIYLESLTFVLFFIPYLLKNKYNIVLSSCPMMANVLRVFKNIFRLQYNIIISNGGPVIPKEISKVDFIAQVTESEYRKSLDWGIPERKLILLPYGLFVEKFNVKLNKIDLRSKYGIPSERFVLLSVGQVNKRHKRMDFIIDTFAKLSDDRYFLLIVGNDDLQTKEIIKMAEKKLKNNFRFLINIEYELMPELYKLADCLIQASLFEGFSRVLLEAMSARIPIIAHDMDNNRWPINNEECLVDMNDIDRVVEKIIKISQDYNLQKLIVEKNYVNVIQRFDWRVLKNHYIEAIRRAFDDLNF